MHHLVDHHKKKVVKPKVDEGAIKHRKEQLFKKVQEEKAKKAEEDEKRKAPKQVRDGKRVAKR